MRLPSLEKNRSLPGMSIIAIYLRVSSTSQDLRSQEADLKRWVVAQDGEVAWYRDKFTGRSMDRPGWNRLMVDVNTGKVKAIVCWRLDRLGRTAKGLTALFAEMQERKINIISLREGIDLNTAAGRMMSNILASVAQFESEVRAERVRAGQAAAHAAGKRWGGSKKGRRLKVTEEQVKMIARMGKEGEAVTTISRTTGLSRPTVYAYL